MHSRAVALLYAFTSSIVFFAAAAAALAQTYQGTIRGIVRDAQGIIPAAEVTLINESTSAARTVITNEVGEYVFPSVLPGTYTLRASLPGFRTEERTGLQLATQQQVVQDFTLEVGVVLMPERARRAGRVDRGHAVTSGCERQLPKRVDE